MLTWIQILHADKSKHQAHDHMQTLTTSVCKWCGDDSIRWSHLKWLMMFNPKTAGGGGGGLNQPPPSTFCATIPPRKFFWPRRSLTFYFQVSRILWHHFREIGHTVTTLHDLLYMLVRPKWLKNMICVQSQCKWSFLTLFIKIWLFSLSLAEINSF